MGCLYLFVVSNSDCAMSFGDDRVIIIVYFGFVIFYFRTLCNTKTRTKSSFSLGSTSILNKTELQFLFKNFLNEIELQFCSRVLVIFPVLVRNENENKKFVRFRFRFGNDKGQPEFSLYKSIDKR